ncbi:hypothetical protein [Roseofilum capinflatum]|uniref:Uncharacterized protein n=1 Tax=Roseofilum capinflatum BLCC-M114 TaxID=3022440 RepID=A0ABT7B3N3_9CYAN|nr:hypothetical protein [Roseofilum capinflatum]MDJ1173239.1 hypothetical protein [Roseofilum capinflatum BLCC-M114]
MIKIANPLYYPTAVFIGGACLVVGVRVLGLSNFIIVPGAIAATVASATALKLREPDAERQEQQQLQQELDNLKATSQMVASKAEELRQEAQRLLTQSSFEIDVLVTVQQVCDDAIELPATIDSIARTLPQGQSLLSVDDLERQLLEVNQKLRSSSEISRQHLKDLKASLERNIQLAKTGQDTRQAKLISLQKMIQDSAGVLQQLQNKLRRADLQNSADLEDLQRLSDELKAYQDNVEILAH